MNLTVRELCDACGGVLKCGDPDRIIRHISTDSRVLGEDTVFVPLIGERVDAHRFLGQASNAGVGCVLCQEEIAPEGGAAWIQVEDTLTAMQKIAILWRSRLTLPVVGVTGSVGKTTTREMIACALSSRYAAFRTAKNLNSTIGLPMTLAEITPENEIAVLEMGMSEFGEMHVLSELARPCVAVVTNIGVAHIMQLKTRENIRSEKLHIVDCMEAGTPVFVCGDNDLLGELKAVDGHPVHTYGLSEKNEFRAIDVEPMANGMSFTFVGGGAACKVVLPVVGEHMILNACAAMAVCLHFGIPAEDAAKALAGFRPFAGRQQIYPVGQMTVIDDTYNASPDSMRAALKTLMTAVPEGKRRIAVLSDMKELGENEVQYHREVGSFAGTLSLDALFCVGELACELGTAAKSSERIGNVFLFPDKESAAPALSSFVRPGDVVLFKGSNSTRIGDLIQCLKACE